jgi:hypothetical protein
LAVVLSTLLILGVYVGASFPLPSSKFQSVELLEADNKTKKIMEESPNLFPKASAKSHLFLSTFARAIEKSGISTKGLSLFPKKGFGCFFIT